MPSASSRLRRPADYAAVFAAPEQRLRGTLWMWLLRRPAQNADGETGRVSDCARLGLAVARKHLPRAVARNRVKRVAREAFRVIAAELGDCDVVLLSANPKTNAASVTQKRPSKTERAARADALDLQWQAWLQPRGRLLQQFKQELATLAARSAAPVRSAKP